MTIAKLNSINPANGEEIKMRIAVGSDEKTSLTDALKLKKSISEINNLKIKKRREFGAFCWPCLSRKFVSGKLFQVGVQVPS